MTYDERIRSRHFRRGGCRGRIPKLLRQPCKRPEDVQLLQGLSNGFEGWLKIEFVRWLCEHCYLKVGVDIGVEYRLKLDQRHGGIDVLEKQCDIWIRAKLSRDVWHYVELKVPFANGNAGKLLRGAADDVWYVSRCVSSERPASANAIVLVVGFSEEQWSVAEALVEERVNFSPVWSKDGGTVGTMRWTIWTKWLIDPPPNIAGLRL